MCVAIHTSRGTVQAQCRGLEAEPGVATFCVLFLVTRAHAASGRRRPLCGVRMTIAGHVSRTPLSWHGARAGRWAAICSRGTASRRYPSRPRCCCWSPACRARRSTRALPPSPPRPAWPRCVAPTIGKHFFAWLLQQPLVAMNCAYHAMRSTGRCSARSKAGHHDRSA